MHDPACEAHVGGAAELPGAGEAASRAYLGLKLVVWVTHIDEEACVGFIQSGLVCTQGKVETGRGSANPLTACTASHASLQ